MIRRFYVHNFRCLENFDLSLASHRSVLLIGANGTGKTSLVSALHLLQKLARGTNRVGEVVSAKDLSFGRALTPMRFELEVEIEGAYFAYSLALELPKGFREMRVHSEKLSMGGSILYSRESAKVQLAREQQDREAVFSIDWHLVALPIIQQRTDEDPVARFRKWLARTVILRPIPQLMAGESNEETLYPDPDARNFGAWFSGTIAQAPSAYVHIDSYLRQHLPDLQDIQNPLIAKETRSLQVNFRRDHETLTLPFADLSDGEKCFFLCALVLAANRSYGPLTCFWDEPDNYLALQEVSPLIASLRAEFSKRGQLITTSHNPEAIRRFAHENTLLLHRRSHLEPATIRSLDEIPLEGDLVGALIRGDVEP